LVTLLAVVTVDRLALPSPSHVSRPAGRAHVQHKITPLKNGETTGVLATFDVDGVIYTLQVGTATGTVELELVGPGPHSDTGVYSLPSPGQLEVTTWIASYAAGMLIAGLAPSTAASVKVATTDGRTIDASLFALPRTYTTDFEAFGAVVPAPLADYEVTAYTADGEAISGFSNSIPSPPPTG
jgi:hypothetical protein